MSEKGIEFAIATMLDKCVSHFLIMIVCGIIAKGLKSLAKDFKEKISDIWDENDNSDIWDENDKS